MTSIAVLGFCLVVNVRRSVPDRRQVFALRRAGLRR